jgi:hypothetical protein
MIPLTKLVSNKKYIVETKEGKYIGTFGGYEDTKFIYPCVVMINVIYEDKQYPYLLFHLTDKFYESE